MSLIVQFPKLTISRGKQKGEIKKKKKTMFIIAHNALCLYSPYPKSSKSFYSHKFNINVHTLSCKCDLKC